LVFGSALLGYGFHAGGDTPGFYAGTLAAAAIWLAGGMLAGPVPWIVRGGRARRVRLTFIAVGLAVALFAVVTVLDLVVRAIRELSDALDRVLSDADRGPLPAILLVALVSAVAEEVFFRGAVYDALYDALGGTLRGRRRVAAAVVVYVVVTAVTANVVLVAAAVLVGTVTTLERDTTGAIGASLVTHLLWSTLMITAFPR
jgi:membrane protease YdiL (CAAX protease family)